MGFSPILTSAQWESRILCSEISWWWRLLDQMNRIPATTHTHTLPECLARRPLVLEPIAMLIVITPHICVCAMRTYVPWSLTWLFEGALGNVVLVGHQSQGCPKFLFWSALHHTVGDRVENHASEWLGNHNYVMHWTLSKRPFRRWGPSRASLSG